MPKGLLQEKFQRTVADPHTDGGNEWANLSDAQFRSKVRKVYEPSKHNYNADGHGEREAGPDSHVRDAELNSMPPGMFIDNQEPRVTERSIPYVAAGASDVSNSVDARMLKKGFQLQRMNGTDDLPTNEHTDEFYGDAPGEDDAGNKYTGYLERNNYLDRN